MSKVLLEKLVRVFSIKRIYLMMYGNDSETVDARLEKLLQGSVRIHTWTFKRVDHFVKNAHKHDDFSFDILDFW